MSGNAGITGMAGIAGIGAGMTGIAGMAGATGFDLRGGDRWRDEDARRSSQSRVQVLIHSSHRSFS